MAPAHVRWLAAGITVVGLVAACGAGGRSAGGSSSALAADTGVVVGRAVVDAGCPVLRPGTPCPTVSLTGPYVVVVTPDSPAGTTRTDAAADGSFRLVLSKGRYRLVGQVPSGQPRGLSQEVTVQAGRTARITLVFDSGVRAAAR